MTREERRKAIKILSTLQTLTTIDGYSEETREALDMVIEELKSESCDDAVSREAVINAFPDILPIVGYSHACIVEIVKSLPPVTPKLKTGKWVAGRTIGDGFTCSECNTHYQIYPMVYQFCPNCGAKNEGESK